MPLYEYACDHCGDFTALRKMGPTSQTAPCPSCGDDAEKVISAPRLSLLDSNTRNAMARNEKSRHAPVHTRKSSCGCSGSHTCGTSKSSSSTAAAREGASPLKAQTKKTARPWMLGH